MVNEMTMTRPRLLDLFCGAGGAAMGYYRAGFDVVGVDIAPQPHFPFIRDERPFTFFQREAMSFLAGLVNDTDCAGGWRLSDFDAIHASPPCQAYSSLKFLHERGAHQHVDLVGATRCALAAIGKPWVIENVVNAPLRHPILLCGSMFGLGTLCADGEFHQLRRHRLFESNILMLSQSCRHAGRPIGVYGNGGGNANRGHLKGVNGFCGKMSERRDAMGIDWMTRDELSQAIPPAYTAYIGGQLIRALAAREREINRNS
jgi:DNA (cytosine-5)-methyltransferase 1